MTDEIPKTAFSRIISVKDIYSKENFNFNVTASEIELIAMSNLFNLEKISSLSARIQLTQSYRNNAVVMTCKFSAAVFQKCVISLELVKTHIQHVFVVEFVEQISDGSPNIGDFDCFLDEQVETITDGKIDIGPVLVQYLGLEINPFPKKEGITLASVYKQGDLTIADEPKPNSFKLLLKDYKFI